jgi:magnesium transporter
MPENLNTLTKDNYQEHEDLSIFPTNQLVSFFTSLPKIKTLNILRGFDQDFILKFLDEAPEHLSIQWKSSLKFKPSTVGELMQPAALVLNENKTIEDAIAQIKTIHKQKQFTYGMIVDDTNVLTGVLVFKDVFYHKLNEKIKDICFKNPICLDAEADILEAYNKIASEQIPEFPVVDSERKLLGSLRGKHVVDAYAIKISAQSGLMVGASPEEGIDSSYIKGIKLRGPWLLINLVTAFVAGGVVGYFQDTIDQIVLLAMFLPILAGQSGNTGAQALAVLIREMTLGEVESKITKQLYKESIMGLVHGFVTGGICAIVMYWLATQQNNPHAFALAIIILISMVASCIISGLMGAFVPVTLKKFGADPAAASSIFLTTGTDVVSMGVMLFLATKFIINT